MNIENKINKDVVKDAIRSAALHTDGFDGEIGGILRSILCSLNWSEEIEDAVSWDSVQGKFEKAIGDISGWYDKAVEMSKLNINSASIRVEFDHWADRKFADILACYNEVLDMINSKVGHTLFLKELDYVNKRGVCQYKIVKHFSGNTKYEAIEKFWEFYKCSIEGNEAKAWTKGELFDALYEKPNMSVCIGKMSFLNLPCYKMASVEFSED